MKYCPCLNTIVYNVVYCSLSERLMCRGMLNNLVIANLLLSVTV